jgi:hypothetical protein
MVAYVERDCRLSAAIVQCVPIDIGRLEKTVSMASFIQMSTRFCRRDYADSTTRSRETLCDGTTHAGRERHEKPTTLTGRRSRRKPGGRSACVLTKQVAQHPDPKTHRSSQGFVSLLAMVLAQKSDKHETHFQN